MLPTVNPWGRSFGSVENHDVHTCRVCTYDSHSIIAPLNHTEVELFLDLWPGKQGPFTSPILPSLQPF